MARGVSASIGTVLYLGACAPPPLEERFYKNGVSIEQQNQDEYECEKETRMATASFGRGPAATANAREFAWKCMRAKGYMYGSFR